MPRPFLLRARSAVVFLLIVLASWSCGGSSVSSYGSGEAPAQGTQGMVSSAHPLATEVGLDVLAKGGNAFDAAVAVAAALNVVEPMMSGMGGYGTILVYSAEEGRARFLNSSGRIPQGVDPERISGPDPELQGKPTGTEGHLHAGERERLGGHVRGIRGSSLGRSPGTRRPAG